MVAPMLTTSAWGGTGEDIGSPVRDVGPGGEFEFWAAVSGITGGPKRPPVPPDAVGAVIGLLTTSARVEWFRESARWLWFS